MFKKLIIILASFFLVPVIYASCTKANFLLEYGCIGHDQACPKVGPRLITSTTGNTRYLTNTNLISINKFDDWLYQKLDQFGNKVGRKSFIVDDYCKDLTSDCGEKNFSFNSLIGKKNSFYIDESTFYNWNNKVKYENGVDYFFKKRYSILTQLNSHLRNTPSDEIIPGMISYNLDRSLPYFKMRRVCENESCSTADIKSVTLGSNESMKLMMGDMVSFNNSYGNYFGFVANSVDYSSNGFNAGQSIGIDFSFQDNLSRYKNCDNFRYKYKILYSYLGYNGEGPKKELLSDNFYVNANGNIINNTQVIEGKVKKINAGVNINGGNSRFTAEINERVVLTKTGKVYFTIVIEDNYGKVLEKRLNSIPIEIRPGTPDPDMSSLSMIGYNESKSYYPGDTFIAHAVIRDKYGNAYADDNKGVKIQHFDPLTRDQILLSNGLGYVQGSVDIKSIDHVTSPYFEFKFNFETPGFYEQKFELNIPLRNASGYYTGANKKINIAIEENGVPKTIAVKRVIGSSDFNLVCTNKPFTLSSQCTSDNLSGCDPAYNGTISFSSEADNGSNGRLIIRDHAENQESFAYAVDHIDMTKPELKVDGLNFSSKKAFDGNIILTTSDYPPSGCSNEIHYKILLNGVEIKQGTVTNKYEEISLNDLKLTQKKGNFNLNIEVVDSVGNTSTYNKNYNIVPNNPSGLFTGITVDQVGGHYANNHDSYNYKVILKDEFDNIIDNKRILSFNQSITNYSNAKTLNTFDGSDALLESSSNWKTNNLGEFTASVKSLTPGNFTQNFEIKVYDWDDNYVNKSSVYTMYKSIIGENTFNKLYEADIVISSNSGSTWLDKPEFGREQLYKVNINKLSPYGDLSNGLLDINSSSIINTKKGHKWGKFNVIDSLNFGAATVKDFIFSARIDADENILEAPKVGPNSLNISYQLGGEKILYPLDGFEVLGCQRDTLGLKVIGKIQGSDKADVTGQDSNFTDLYKAGFRATMRQNGYSLIKNMTNGETLNNVKYVDGDITISGNNLGYETLVVKNGNVIISGDLNTDGNTLGVIVLKDNYRVESDYNQKGNIYVSNNVNFIDAAIYADGVFRSAKSNGVEYADTELGRKLEFFGNLFSRNTIGGAVSAGSEYILPGGAKTPDIDLASIYDLNFMRKTDACGDDYSILIRYNSNIQTNPPKGFKQ